jgi:hypothetical protein
LRKKERERERERNNLKQSDIHFLATHSYTNDDVASKGTDKPYIAIVEKTFEDIVSTSTSQDIFSSESALAQWLWKNRIPLFPEFR